MSQEPTDTMPEHPENRLTTDYVGMKAPHAPITAEKEAAKAAGVKPPRPAHVILNLPPFEVSHWNHEPDFLFTKHTRRIFNAGRDNFAKLERLERNRRHGYTVMVEGTDHWFPLAIIQGAHPGPTALVTAGIHSCEHPGIKAALELSYEIDASELHGTVLVVPLANTSGFWRRGSSMIAQTETNLNRVFPGDALGTSDERLGNALFELGRVADCFIDLHSGDSYEALTPHAYYRAGLPASDASRALATCVDVPYLLPFSGYHTGAAYSALTEAGIPSVLIERGGMLQCERSDVDAFKTDVRSILMSLGMIEGEAPDYAAWQSVLVDQHFDKAGVTGFWEARVQPGDAVKPREVLGVTRDPFGNVMETLLAQTTGVVLYQTNSLNIVAGEVAVAYAGTGKTL